MKLKSKLFALMALFMILMSCEKDEMHNPTDVSDQKTGETVDWDDDKSVPAFVEDSNFIKLTNRLAAKMDESTYDEMLASNSAKLADLLDEDFIRESRADLANLNAKYGGILSGVKNIDTVKKQLKGGISPWCKNTLKEREKRVINDWKTRVRSAKKILNKPNYNQSDYLYRVLYEMAIMHHSIIFRRRLGLIYLWEDNNCQGYTIAPDPENILLYIAYYASAESTLKKEAKKLGAVARFTNPHSLNVALKVGGRYVGADDSRYHRVVMVKRLGSYEKLELKIIPGKRVVAIRSRRFNRFLETFAGTKFNYARFSTMSNDINKSNLFYVVPPKSAHSGRFRLKCIKNGKYLRYDNYGLRTDGNGNSNNIHFKPIKH